MCIGYIYIHTPISDCVGLFLPRSGIVCKNSRNACTWFLHFISRTCIGWKTKCTASVLRMYACPEELWHRKNLQQCLTQMWACSAVYASPEGILLLLQCPLDSVFLDLNSFTTNKSDNKASHLDVEVPHAWRLPSSLTKVLGIQDGKQIPEMWA